MKSGGKWIQKAIKHPGSFTKQAQSAGMSVAGFRNKVLANKSNYSSTTVRRANLAKTLSKMRKGEDGMEVDPMEERDGQLELLDPGNKMAKQMLVDANKDLDRQAEKESVAKYQAMLNKKYGLDLKVDGAWGKNTQAAYDKYVKGAGNKNAEKPMTKAQEAIHGTAKNPVRMDEIAIKVKPRTAPIRMMPNTPAPYKRPNLTDYLNRPAAQMPVPSNRRGPTIRQQGTQTSAPFMRGLMGYGMGGSIPGVNGSVIGPSVPTPKTGQSFPRRNAGTSKLAKFKKK
jgi:hypothetical protein